MNAQSRFLPSASSPWNVAGPSAMTSPVSTCWPGSDDGLLRVAGVLVGALVLQKRIDVLVPLRLVGLDADLDGGDVGDDAAALRDHHDARIVGGPALHARPDARGLGGDEGNCLALHVGSHEGAVGVVVLEERDERRGNGDDLLRGDVHVLDVLRRPGDVVAALAHRDLLLLELALGGERRVGLRDEEALLVHGGEVFDVVAHLAVLHLAVRGLEEAVLVDAGVVGQGDDEPDVRTLRGLDGAHPCRSGCSGRRAPRIRPGRGRGRRGRAR